MNIRRVLMIAFLVGVVSVIVPAAAIAAEREPIYNESADAKADIAAAVAKAQAEGHHVLLQWGGNWCGWCHKLHDLFESDEAIGEVLDANYEVVMIDSRSNKALAQELGTDVRAVPFLTVLDAEGRKLVDQRTGPLEIGNRHDPAKVLAFLTAWAPAPSSAGEVLERGLAQAAVEDKRLFVEFSTPTCGWCRRLEAFLDRENVKPVFEKYFVNRNIDQARWDDAGALRKKLSERRGGGGVPWFAILDANGEVLTTATGPRGNIGYPLEPEGAAHFLKMLQESAPDLTADELATIESELEANNAAINKELGR